MGRRLQHLGVRLRLITYFIDSDGHLKLLDSKTGRTKTIIAAPGVLGAEMSVSPDERWMIYETSARASELMLVEGFH